MSDLDDVLDSFFREPNRLTLSDLLGRGYFPKELPPAFTTKEFASIVDDENTELPVIFTKKKSDWVELTKYSLARAGELRRVLSIVNPRAYYRLAKVVVDEQETLFKKAGPGNFSLSDPILGPRRGRALVPEKEDNERTLKIIELRVGKRFCLKTDIAQFYPSIYTHSLDWAITGKSKAKANFNGSKAKSRLGCRIDSLVQACQNGQTRGIPIGPDTSLLLSSILLARVDTSLNKFNAMVGVRFMDDYQLMLDSEEHAEKSLAALENALAEYELTLNPKKTILQKLPDPVEDRFTSKLSNHGVNGDVAFQEKNIIRFFDRAFRYSKKFPEKPVLHYAVGIIKNIWHTVDARKLTLDLILQAIVVEPGVLRLSMPVLEQIYIEESPSLEALGKVLNIVVETHALRNHSSEVAWALTAYTKFNIKLPSKIVNAVSKMNDDVCALMLLYACDKNICVLGVDSKKRLIKQFDQNLKGSHWLFTYTAYEKKWLSPSDESGIEADELYTFLSDNQISFFDETMIEVSENNVELEERYHSTEYGHFQEQDQDSYEDEDFYRDEDDL